MRRIRVEAKIDRDSASPDSIAAAQQYLTGAMFEKAVGQGVALDWSKFNSYVRRRGTELIMVQWARVL